MKNILKILIVFLIFLGLHIRTARKIQEVFIFTQSTWQHNLITARRYLHRPNFNRVNVIVGTSLSMRIRHDRLNNTENLSFAGQNIFNGLELINRSELKPKRVFIEMNLVLRPADEHLFSVLFSPVPFFLKKHIRHIREDRQPITIFGFFLREILIAPQNKAIQKWKKNFTEKENLPVNLHNGNQNLSTKNIDPGKLTKGHILMDKQKKEYTMIPDESELDSAFQNLKLYTDEFQKAGIEIVFFEMPVHPVLCETPRAVAIRNAFHKKYPDSAFSYLPKPDCTPYNPSDGVHLGPEDAERYRLYFNKYLQDRVKNISQNKKNK